MSGTPAGDLRVVFLGTPESAVPTLRAVHAAGFHLPLVVTRPDRRKGRGARVGAAPVKVAAEELGLPLFQPESLNAPDALERLRAAAPDVVLIVAYGQILKKAVLEASRLLPVNVHFSLLPEYRGAAPVAKAVADGRTRTGVTLQRVVRKLDAGPVLAAEEVEIGEEETAGELMARLAEVGAALAVETLARLARGEVEEVPQDESRVSLAPMMKKEDGRIDWTRPAVELHCHVRAMDPWPGATTRLFVARRPEGLPVTILRCRRGPEEDSGRAPGEVAKAGKDGILVQTGEGLLALISVKPAGKRALTAQELLNGYRVAPGDRLG